MIGYYTQTMIRKRQFKLRVPTSILIPVSLQRAIARRAESENRSFSAVIRRAIQKDLGLSLKSIATNQKCSINPKD